MYQLCIKDLQSTPISFESFCKPYFNTWKIINDVHPQVLFKICLACYPSKVFYMVKAGNLLGYFHPMHPLKLHESHEGNNVLSSISILILGLIKCNHSSQTCILVDACVYGNESSIAIKYCLLATYYIVDILQQEVEKNIDNMYL